MVLSTCQSDSAAIPTTNHSSLSCFMLARSLELFVLITRKLQGDREKYTSKQNFAECFMIEKGSKFGKCL